jgi:hypothetical protein
MSEGQYHNLMYQYALFTCKLTFASKENGLNKVQMWKILFLTAILGITFTPTPPPPFSKKHFSTQSRALILWQPFILFKEAEVLVKKLIKLLK